MKRCSFLTDSEIIIHNSNFCFVFYFLSAKIQLISIIYATSSLKTASNPAAAASLLRQE